MRDVAGARVDGLAAGRGDDALHRLHRRTGAILFRLAGVHRGVNGAGGVDPGASRLIGEADEVGVGEAVAQRRQVRPLAVVEVEDLGALVAGVLGRDLAGLLALDLALAGLRALDGVGVDADRLAVGGVRDQTDGEHDEIGVKNRAFAQQRVAQRHLEMAVAAHRGHLATGEERAGLLLDREVEALELPRRPHVAVDDGGLDIGVGAVDGRDLPQRGRATVGGAVGQVLGIAGTGALDEHDALRHGAVRGALEPAAGEHGVELGRGDHVGRGAVTEMAELARVVRARPGRLDDGAGGERDLAGGRGELDVELARLTRDRLDRRGGEDPHPGVGGELGDEPREMVVVERVVRRPVGHQPLDRSQRAAKGRGLLDHDHRVPEVGGGPGRGQAGEAAADHQHGRARSSPPAASPGRSWTSARSPCGGGPPPASGCPRRRPGGTTPPVRAD